MPNCEFSIIKKAWKKIYIEMTKEEKAKLWQYMRKCLYQYLKIPKDQWGLR